MERVLLDRIKLHPLATIIPDMTGEERSDLLASMKSEGQLVPITVTAHDIIVDGRHRYEAARLLGWESVLVERIQLEDSEALQYMITTAVTRRHLTAGQKAAILIQYDEVIRGAFKEIGIKGRDVLAAKAQVSPRTIQDALTLKVLSPDHFEQVRTGKITAKEALRKVRPVEDIEKFHPRDPIRLAQIVNDLATEARRDHPMAWWFEEVLTVLNGREWAREVVKDV